jgi:CBS domain containing-hemolysin-like protein
MEVHVMTGLDVPVAGPLARLGTVSRMARLPVSLQWPAVVLITALVELGAGFLGLWWVTVLAGVLLGASTLRHRILALLAATAIAWIAGILLESGSLTFQIAGVVSAEVFNARALGWMIVVLTAGYALLLALAGAWIGGAARRLASWGKRGSSQPASAMAPMPTAAEDVGVPRQASSHAKEQEEAENV